MYDLEYDWVILQIHETPFHEIYDLNQGFFDHLNIWSDFLVIPGSMDLSFFGETFTKSGIGSCIAPKAGLARHPVQGRYFNPQILVTFGLLVVWDISCPGPVSKWGDPFVLLARTEAESPSISVFCIPGGGGRFKKHMFGGPLF